MDFTYNQLKSNNAELKINDEPKSHISSETFKTVCDHDWVWGQRDLHFSRAVVQNKPALGEQPIPVGHGISRHAGGREPVWKPTCQDTEAGNPFGSDLSKYSKLCEQSDQTIHHNENLTANEVRSLITHRYLLEHM